MTSSHSERASGRHLDRSLLAPRLEMLKTELSRRIQGAEFSIGRDLADDRTLAFLYLWEAFAHAVFQTLQAALFSRRLGPAKNDGEVFTIFARAGVFDLVEARRLRQFCEARHLASRDLGKLDPGEIARSAAEELAWICETLVRLEAPIAPPIGD